MELTNLSMKALDEIDKVALVSEPKDLSKFDFGPGYAWKFRFLNGRGASVIKRLNCSYGAEDDLWELAVLDENMELDYSTPITQDVEGYLTEDDVVQLCKEIAALPEV